MTTYSIIYYTDTYGNQTTVDMKADEVTIQDGALVLSYGGQITMAIAPGAWRFIGEVSRS